MAQLVGCWRVLQALARRVLALLAVLAASGAAQSALGGSVLDGVAYAVDGAESGHGTDPRMWRPEPDGPQGPMQVSAAAAADTGGGDRFDETQNRVLGRAYLARMFRRYGSWPDAIAAYNWGPGHLDEWIDGGRPVDKFPAAVERYRNRVLVTAGLSAVAGGPSFYRWANLRLARLERLRTEARRQLSERRRTGRRPEMVELLYAEIMRSTASARP